MKQISQMEPWFDECEKHALIDYMDSGGWLTEFRKTQEFEQAIANYTGSKYVCVVANGTVSLFIALQAMNIGQGDEVIVPDFTMIASANAVLLAGAKPVFVDISMSDLCLDIDLTEQAITNRTKAIMLVSINGRSPDMKAFRNLADKYNLHLLEDSAQSLGSFHNGRHLGTFGEIGSFSFSAPKVVTTGQGGALVTDSEELYQCIRRIKDFGRSVGGIDFHESIGYNFKFTDLQAVIGIEQMKKLPWRVQRKKEIYSQYQEELAKLEQVQFPLTNLVDTSPWFIDVLIPDPDKLLQYLRKYNIGSRRFYPAIHSQPAYKRPGSYPKTEYISEHGLWLPSSSFLTNDQISQICSIIHSFYQN